MDVKTLSAMLGHVSAATTLDIYTHITDDMRLMVGVCKWFLQGRQLKG
jgi:site-specific recombinase XerD